MHKKLFRLSLAILAVAVAAGAGARPAMALTNEYCPDDLFIDGCDCPLANGITCSECRYDCTRCPPIEMLITVNECDA